MGRHRSIDLDLPPRTRRRNGGAHPVLLRPRRPGPAAIAVGVVVKTLSPWAPVFLIPSELIELTGRKRPSAQAAQLGRMGWAYVMSGAGRPLVLKAYAEDRLAGRAPGAPRTAGASVAAKSR